MNVAARIGMEIHAVLLSALFLEVVKNCYHKCPLSQCPNPGYFTNKNCIPIPGLNYAFMFLYFKLISPSVVPCFPAAPTTEIVVVTVAIRFFVAFLQDD